MFKFLYQVLCLSIPAAPLYTLASTQLLWMIRGNYSLAREVRKSEQKLRLRIQQKQKHAHLLEKLQRTDPIRLHFQIERLESGQLDGAGKKRLQKLKEHWAFMQKNGLHKEKIQAFLEQQRKKQAEEEKARTRLWGKESVYFNPELNPLGKVPDWRNLDGFSEPLPNAKKPVQRVAVEPDPEISLLGIQPPEGAPPKFYRAVQNTRVKE